MGADAKASVVDDGVGGVDDRDRRGLFSGRRHVAFVVLGVIAATTLYVLRRPDELRAPYIWDEEALILVQLQADGLWAIFQPLNGQLILSSSALVVLAASISWRWLPMINYGLMVGTFVVTALIVLLPRSRWGSLPIRVAMVAYLAVIPVNPETYGVLLYSFWWTALWPMLIAGWKTESNRWRLPLLVFAGLSSIAAAGQFVVFLVDGVVHRSKQRLWCAAALAACLVVQLVAYARSTRPASSSIADTIQQAAITPVDFVVRPLVTWTATSRGLLGVAFAVAVGVMIWLVKDAEIRWAAFLLGLSAIWFTALSAIPAAPDSDPVINGPRYFFLPFAAFGVLLLLLISVARTQRVIGAVAAVALLFALLGTRDTFIRRTDRLNWAEELERCAASAERSYRLPDHFDGKLPTPWYLPLDTSFCRSVVGS